MSWIEQVETDFIIVTGDGVRYVVNWLNAKRLQEWNMAEFDFPEIDGTLVKRSRPLGTKYSLEIYFQGQDNKIDGGSVPPVTGLDHLDISDQFYKSANNTNYWTVEHPFYGSITVQPSALEYDNSSLNVTKITGMIMETITQDAPITTVEAVDSIPIQKSIVDSDIDDLYETPGNNLIPSSADINWLKNINQINYALGVSIITVPSEFQSYIHALNQMNAAVNNAIADISLAVNLANQFITLPALFTQSLITRTNTLLSQFANFRQNISALVNPSSKFLYQITAGSVIGSLCLASVNLTDEDEGLSANQILNIMNLIYQSWQDYLADLDSLQTANGGNTNSFIPDAQTMIDLNSLVNIAISNLYQIILSSKQQRIIYTDKDTNIILLAHMLYGLDNADANISELISENDIGLNEIYEIKKGRKILYYI